MRRRAPRSHKVKGAFNMSPLDTGSVTHTLRVVDPLDARVEPVVTDYPTVGAYLRAVREHRGRSLSEICNATRVSRAYLSAVEESRVDALPSRPFAIGYVRSYAAALGLDEDAVVARYKAELPGGMTPLQAPIGVRHEKPERRPMVFAIAAVVVLAVVAWNIAQRAMKISEPPPPAIPAVDLSAAPAPTGPIALGAALPPPAEQTMPAPYVTPGLGVGPAPAPAEPPTALISPILDRSAPFLFASKTEVHGVPAIGPTVVLQAREPASLIVRGPTGEVHFARQLVKGEAFRAPIGQKLVADVIDPAAFAVYINNQLQGALAAPQTPLDKAVAEAVASQPAVPSPVIPSPAAVQPAQ